MMLDARMLSSRSSASASPLLGGTGTTLATRAALPRGLPVAPRPEHRLEQRESDARALCIARATSHSSRHRHNGSQERSAVVAASGSKMLPIAELSQPDDGLASAQDAAFTADVEAMAAGAAVPLLSQDVEENPYTSQDALRCVNPMPSLMLI